LARRCWAYFLKIPFRIKHLRIAGIFHGWEHELSQFLISVRNLDEAKIVARHPIGILDVKEPSRGSLGAANPCTLLEIADSIEPGLAKSFSAGELADWIDVSKPGVVNSLQDWYGKSVLSRYRFIKVGLANMLCRADWENDWHSLFRHLPGNLSPVLVAYLDHTRCDAPGPAEIIKFASEQSTCQTILFDTHDKSENLFFHLSENQLTEMIASTKRNNLTSVVAGSIDVECLEAVRLACPNFIGIRGAVCRNCRTSEIDEDRLRRLLSDAGT
jgi:uncharacterized protein (UPF0264 family)